MLEKLNKILEEFKNDESPKENSYYRYLETETVDENGWAEEKCIEDEIYNLFKEYPEIKYSYDYIGGFDSVGYTIECEVLTIVINNEIYNFPLNYEVF